MSNPFQTDLMGNDRNLTPQQQIDETVKFIREQLEFAVERGVGWNFYLQALEFKGVKDGCEWGILAGMAMLITVDPSPTLLDPKLRDESPLIKVPK